MNTRKLQFEVYHQTEKWEYGVRLFYEENGKIFVAQPLIFKEYKIGDVIKPLFEIRSEYLPDLAKGLYTNKSEDAGFLKGKLEATQFHLDDMRRFCL